jgi:hypothetical protein
MRRVTCVLSLKKKGINHRLHRFRRETGRVQGHETCRAIAMSDKVTVQLFFNVNFFFKSVPNRSRTSECVWLPWN